MSGLKPFFITGANAKIKLNGKTLAFCTDLSYSIQVLHQTPKILGMYEGSSVEPLGYNVNGSFSVVRYVKGATEGTGSKVHSVSTNDAGNGVGNWGGNWGGNSVGSQLGLGNDGRANEALDPSKFDSGTTFDIQVYQKVANRIKTNDVSLNNVSNILQGETSSSAFQMLNKVEYIGVANIRNCRIVQSDFSITKKGAVIQKFNFTALYVDEDSFVADFSGRGHHF